MTIEAPQIRTFHPRRGRMGTTQAGALARLWATRGLDIDTDTVLDAEAMFGRRAPLVLEIGSGMGDATIAMAAADPDRDYLAVDVHTPGLGSLLAQAEALGLDNVRAGRGDAVELLRHGIAPGGTRRDPHLLPGPVAEGPPPQAPHRLARRWSRLMRDRLVIGGLLHTATDWSDYAEQMLEVLGADPGLRNLHDGFAPRPAHRPVTKYERRGAEAGRVIRDCLFTRTT